LSLFDYGLHLVQAVQMESPLERSQLDGLVVFLAVAELRGFRAAGRRLGVTPSAVSQAIRALEGRIGAPLFTRTTRSVGLTEAGERLLAYARPAVDMLSAGLGAASSLGSQISGRLRINTPRASLPLLINRLLPGFLDLHPDVQLELVGDDGLVDVVDGGFDAGIRLGDLIEADMIAVRLTPAEPFAVVGTPAFFAKYGRPRRPHDLHEFRCILLRQPAGLLDRWQFKLGEEDIMVGVAGPLILDDVEACIGAALRSVGLFRLPRSIVSHYLEQGTLETVLDRNAAKIPGLFLYYPSRSTALPKLRAFIDYATKQTRRDFLSDDYLPH
jgi:DNA-binding transcriptional LysR family regulator